MELLINYGSEVKSVKENKVEGYLVIFSDKDSPDLDGDFFTSETDFDLFEEKLVRGVYYQHGHDSVIKSRRIGVAEIKKDEIGLWISAQLDLRDDYERAILELATQGKLGWSSGAAGHLVERIPFAKSQFIKKWIIAEASLTPIPAEPRSIAITKTISSGLTLASQTDEAIMLLNDLASRYQKRKERRENEGRKLSDSQKLALWEIMGDIKSLLEGYEPPELINTKLRDELNRLRARFIKTNINTKEVYK